ncbi:MAG: hypothetical protein DMD77_20515 [Candidatus Rokuibacteriota bacterium]|nr:MAG: hypothetical protein DMD77_20515 [Candidatus Rokubacteria bacterium]
MAVEEDGPAAKAGLEPGDVILGMDGTVIDPATGVPHAQLRSDRHRQRSRRPARRDPGRQAP